MSALRNTTTTINKQVKVTETIFHEEKGEEEEKEYKFENQKFSLTYKTHVDKVKIAELIETVLGSTPKFLRTAHESADEKNQYLHSHVVIDVGHVFKRKGKGASRIFDFEGIHPHVEFIKDKKHWQNSVMYLAKEDVDNADLKGLFDKPTCYEVAKSYMVLEDYLKTAVKPSDVMGMIALWRAVHGNNPTVESCDTFNNWQLHLLCECEENGNQRQITWIYDPVGATGKTYFCKAMVSKFPTKVLSLGNCHTARDAATIIQIAIEKGWTGDTVLINLSRQATDHKIYEWIENIRDGFVTATKYSGGTVLFNCYHFIVFANWCPNVDALSLDRWDIRLLCEGPTSRNMGWVPITLKEARQYRQAASGADERPTRLQIQDFVADLPRHRYK